MIGKLTSFNLINRSKSAISFHRGRGEGWERALLGERVSGGPKLPITPGIDGTNEAKVFVYPFFILVLFRI